MRISSRPHGASRIRATRGQPWQSAPPLSMRARKSCLPRSTEPSASHQPAREACRRPGEIWTGASRNSARNATPPPTGAIVGVEAWNTVLHGILESPKLPNQSSKRFLQVTPIVPGAALFSGSARLSSNSWPAGSLIRRMICLGSKDGESAQRLWQSLFAALSVDDEDDVFARWLDQETSAWTPGASNWALSPIPADEMATLETPDFLGIPFLPARRFTKDLQAIMQAKGSMTRRQWTSLLEALLRLAAASHVTWLCDVHSRTWSCLWATLTDGIAPSSELDARRALFPEAPQYMTYGGKALQGIKDKVSSYLNARLGINALLWSLEQIGPPLLWQPLLERRDYRTLPAYPPAQGRAHSPRHA